MARVDDVIASFVGVSNDMAREAALSAVVQVWRDLQGTAEGARVIEVYAGCGPRFVEDLVVLRRRIDAVLRDRGGVA